MGYVLGIDVGESKTHAAVLNTSGRQLAARSGRSLSLRYLGNPEARRALYDLAASVLADAGATLELSEAVGVGMAGVDTQEDIPKAERLIRDAGIRVPTLVVENDAVAAWYAATGGDPGVVVVSGTGSIAYGVNEAGHWLRVGGLGPVVSDEGSGYDLARRGIIAAIWAEEERGPATSIRTALLARLCLDSVREIRRLAHPIAAWSPGEMAALAPVVLGEAERGDSEALRLARGAGWVLGGMAVTTARRLPLSSPQVVGVGGILLGSDIVFSAFEAFVTDALPESSVRRSVRTPAEGAAIMALRVARGAPRAGGPQDGL